MTFLTLEPGGFFGLVGWKLRDRDDMPNSTGRKTARVLWWRLLHGYWERVLTLNRDDLALRDGENGSDWCNGSRFASDRECPGWVSVWAGVKLKRGHGPTPGSRLLFVARAVGKRTGPLAFFCFSKVGGWTAGCMQGQSARIEMQARCRPSTEVWICESSLNTVDMDYPTPCPLVCYSACRMALAVAARSIFL